MADEALRRIRCGLLVVDGDEVGAVHRVPHRLIETESRRNRWDGDAMASGALALCMTLRAQVRLRVRLHAVLAKEVSVVDDVAFGQRHFTREVDVTPAAVARSPLVLVGVATEARWVLDPYVVGIDRHVHVASNTVPCAFLEMELVREPQMPPRHFSRVAISRSAMTVSARVGVVWLLVALDAVRCRWEVKRPLFAGFWNSCVAPEAVDAFDDVRAMLEGVILLFLLEAKHFGASPGGASKRDHSSDCHDLSHLFPRQVCW